jgi:hypothetical protein
VGRAQLDTIPIPVRETARLRIRINLAVRMTEYTLPGYHDYGLLLVEALKPAIDAKYRTISSKEWSRGNHFPMA